jgi:hypothetical protein
MPKKQRKFADDGWAVWIDGDDVSTIYINDWLNPKGKSYVDFAVRIRGVMASKLLSVYVPFEVKKEEIEDVSFLFNDTNILQATFSSSCIIEYKKNYIEKYETFYLYFCNRIIVCSASIRNLNVTCYRCGQ